MKHFKELSSVSEAYFDSYCDIPPIEREKFQLTIDSTEKMQREEYGEAVPLLRKLAGLCRNQGNESDAYQVEHRIFLCEQMCIYMEADIPLDAFDEIPYVEIFKVALTRLAEQAWVQNNRRLFTFYKCLNAELCRAQEKYNDAWMIKHDLLSHQCSNSLPRPFGEWEFEAMRAAAAAYQEEFQTYQ